MMSLLIIMTGLMAGIYFTFSVVVMKSLAKLPSIQGAQAMNKINDVIVNTLFLPIFFGTTVWYLGLLLWSIVDGSHQQSHLIITAAVIYIAGMFLVTIFGSVPLNNQLKKYEFDDAKLLVTWERYLHKWTQLNHIRTLSCLLACWILIKL